MSVKQKSGRVSSTSKTSAEKSSDDVNAFADVAIVDPYFIKNSSKEIIKNSVIDACAQATEAYHSKLSNPYTKLLCENAFNILENAILNKTYEKLPLGSLICGLGFGNSSTTLGHALSYVYSNEGYSHGHALAYTTQIAHKFNNSKFYERFKKIVDTLQFLPIKISTPLDKAAELILTDKKHLDNNPKPISKDQIIKLLKNINLSK